MPITVGIDGYNLALANGTGIATYSRTLAATIARLGWSRLGLFGVDSGSDRALQEILFFERLMRPPVKRKFSPDWLRLKLGGIPKLEEISLGSVDTQPLSAQIPKFNRIVTGNALFQAAFRQFSKTGKIATIQIAQPPQIMHWTCPIPLKVAGSINVYSVHDMVPLRMPYMTLDDKRLHHALVSACVSAADHLCAVSEYSAKELIDLFPAASGKVTTTYQTCDITDYISDLSDREGREFITCLGLQPDGYFLFYGALEPKKNIPRLIEAYMRLGSETPFVVVTGRSWNSEAENNILKRLSRESGKVIVLEYLTRGMLQYLIANARAVTLPSLHEGFGLPILEAMQMGVPVLTGNSGGVIEVAGEGGIQVSPYDVVAIRDALARLDGDPNFRHEMARKGRIQANKFSPENYARTMHATYEKLLTKVGHHGVR